MFTSCAHCWGSWVFAGRTISISSSYAWFGADTIEQKGMKQKSKQEKCITNPFVNFLKKEILSLKKKFLLFLIYALLGWAKGVLLNRKRSRSVLDGDAGDDDLFLFAFLLPLYTKTCDLLRSGPRIKLFLFPCICKLYATWWLQSGWFVHKQSTKK